MATISGIILGLIGLASLIIPRAWKTAQEKKDSRKEKAKDDWDGFYKDSE